MHRWTIAASLLALSACAGEYDVRLQAAPTELLERASVAEVAIVPNCLGQLFDGPVEGDPYLRFEVDGVTPPLGEVPPGSDGLFARLLDDQCMIIAAGCSDIDLEGGGSGTLSVSVEPQSGDACLTGQICRAGECVQGDAGPSDGGPDVRGLPDSSVPDARDAGPDVVDIPDAPDPPDAFDAAADAFDAGPFVDPCDSIDALICDSFEEGPVRYVRNFPVGSSIDLSTEQAHSGTQSVKIHAASGEDYATLEITAFDTEASGDRWARVWMWLPPGATNLTPLTIASDGIPAITVYAPGGQRPALEAYMFGGEQSASARQVLLQEQWVCLEVHLDYDGPNTVELYIDGLRSAELTEPLPVAFPNVTLGAAFRDPTDPNDYDIYVDDIVMSLERVGCDH